MTHPLYSPKGPQSLIFPHVIQLFHKLKGQVSTPNYTNITTKELLNETISTYIVAKPLITANITQVHEVVESVHSDGQVQLHNGKQLKEMYQLRRKISEKTMRILREALPNRTRPPNHLFFTDENGHVINMNGFIFSNRVCWVELVT